MAPVAVAFPGAAEASARARDVTVKALEVYDMGGKRWREER